MNLLLSLTPTKESHERNSQENRGFAGKTGVFLGARGGTSAEVVMMGLCWLCASPGAGFAEGHRETASFLTAFSLSPLLPGGFSVSLSTHLGPGPQMLG